MNSVEKIVYLVEPDIAVRDSIKSLLESYEVKIKTFATGRSFLNNAKLNGHDCVLVENALPDMTGIEVCERLRVRGNEVPVVILTSANDVGFIEANKQCVAAIIQKPLKSQDLVEIINAL